MWLLLPLALAQDLLITNARLWDGTGGPAQIDQDILIEDGTISQVGHDLPVPAGTEVLDAEGATVTPGLIDSHVHLSMDPGAAWRTTTPTEHADLVAAHLRGLLACGVTTILDPAILPAELALIRTLEDVGAPGPRVLTLGVPFSPPSGYVSAVIEGFPSVATPAEVEAQLDQVLAMGAVGVKVTVETGPLGPLWPLHTPEILHAIRDGAAARGLPVYVHAMTPEAQRLALAELAPHATVHAPNHEDKALIAEIHAAGIWEQTTLLISEIGDTRAFRRRLDDPLVVLTVPEVERATVADRRLGARYTRQVLDLLAPDAPMKGLIAHLPGRHALSSRMRRQAGRALVALDRAGVPLVMGSDSGNWPLIPFLFHGPSSIWELERLARTGLSPQTALLAATRNAAQMLGRPAELGTVQPGRAADLLVVDGQPDQDIGALRHLRWVVAGGVAATPQAWASATPPLIGPGPRTPWTDRGGPR